MAERTLRWFSMLGAAVCAVWFSIWLQWGVYPLALLLATAGAGYVGCYPAWRRLGLGTASHLAIAVSYVTILTLTLATGGIRGTMGAWFFVLPVGAALLLGIRQAALWGLLFIGTVLALSTAELHGVRPPDLVPADLRTYFHLAAQFSVLVVSFALALIYADSQDRARRRAEESQSSTLMAAHRLREQNALLSALLETGNRYHLQLDFPSLIQQIAEAIRSALGWDYVGITVRVAWEGKTYLVTRAGAVSPEMRSVSQYDRDPVEKVEPLMREEFRISGSYFIDHRNADQVRAHTDLIPSPNFGSQDTDGWHAEDVLLIPILLRGELIGMIAPDEPADGRKPSLEAVQALELFANQAAVAIDNARLYQEQRTRSEELERAYAELRASQERLLVSEKMAALGRVTAGIAHEINSPLGGILNALQLAKSYAEEYESSISDPEVEDEDHRQIAGDLQETLRLAEGATRKVAQFVRSIKDQTRQEKQPPGERKRFDPASEIESTLALIAHALEERRVTVRADVVETGHLQGDPEKFSLVLQNLITNAADAYDGRPGEVLLRCERKDGSLWLEVEDHGSGIPEEIRGRIFDYLFTTKEVGRGTGLGLSMVHSLMTNHFGGEIHLVSEVGAGTTFRLSFPIAD